jgi:predicted RNA polymerase sigma factor
MARGPDEGLKLLALIEDDDRIATDHRLSAVRAHLLEMSGDPVGARAAYEEAASRTTSLPQQRYLNTRASRLTQAGGAGHG